MKKEFLSSKKETASEGGRERRGHSEKRPRQTRHKHNTKDVGQEEEASWVARITTEPPYICISSCTCVYVCVCLCVCISVCVCVCVYNKCTCCMKQMLCVFKKELPSERNRSAQSHIDALTHRSDRHIHTQLHIHIVSHTHTHTQHHYFLSAKLAKPVCSSPSDILCL